MAPVIWKRFGPVKYLPIHEDQCRFAYKILLAELNDNVTFPMMEYYRKQIDEFNRQYADKVSPNVIRELTESLYDQLDLRRDDLRKGISTL